NGESKETRKTPHPPGDDKGEGLSDRRRVFRGSIVAGGEGIFRVTHVGGATYYGQVARELAEKPKKSPLSERMGVLARSISRIGYIGAALIAAADLFYTVAYRNHFSIDAITATLRNPTDIVPKLIAAVTLAVSVVVMAVPEGLPLMITVVLSSNMKRMLRDNVLVRRLVGVETSGNINILFTDKTGTLTRGRLSVAFYLTGDCKRATARDSALAQRLRLCAEHNTSAAWDAVSRTARAVGGNATERAFLEFFRPVPRALRVAAAEVVRTAYIPFESARKFSAAAISAPGGAVTLYKGAPEKLIPVCKTYLRQNGTTAKLQQRRVSAALDALASGAYRLLAVAEGEAPPREGEIPAGLRLLAVLAIRDELRPTAKSAVADAHRAGVQVVMITGDNKLTAAAVARECGLICKSGGADVLTSAELSALTDAEAKRILPSLRVVARAVPSDKSRLVRLAQELSLVTGMTGDGINDAPALKLADVGFAMGSGSEVAKEAGDIVILDDNFLSVAKTILYGRTIFKSIRKFIVFRLAINVVAMGISSICPFLGIASPITVMQMLWLNMIMDSLAGLAFAGEAPLPEFMEEPPKKRGEELINSYMANQIAVLGIYGTVLCLVFLKLPAIRSAFATQGSFMTGFFVMFIFACILIGCGARTGRLNFLAHIFKNKMFIFIMGAVAAAQLVMVYKVGSLFHMSRLTMPELRVCAIAAATVLPVESLRKLFMGKKQRNSI
ncbi:MAG: cation-translocating P-type ATPase, partial [Oscillospiraceae bacterium]|nr:cation-translocating P-type ATPase [Oscillospiraceae bacterium]